MNNFICSSNRLKSLSCSGRDYLKCGAVFLILILSLAGCKNSTPVTIPSEEMTIYESATTETPPTEPTEPLQPPANTPEEIEINVPTLPPLQLITRENAVNVQLITTLEIPGFDLSRQSQCSVEFSIDGKWLCGACGNSQISVWAPGTTKPVYILGNADEENLVSCAFSDNSKIIASGGFNNLIQYWDLESGDFIGETDYHQGPVWDIDFSPDGNHLLSSSLIDQNIENSENEIRLWNFEQEVFEWKYSNVNRLLLSTAFNSNGKFIAVGESSGVITILDPWTGEVSQTLNFPGWNVGTVEFSLDGSLLAAGSDDNRIWVINTNDFQEPKSIYGHSGYVNGVAFHPDGNLVTSGSHDKTVGITDLSREKLLIQLTGHEDAVLRVAFNPAGTMIASISWDGTVRIWGILE